VACLFLPTTGEQVALSPLLLPPYSSCIILLHFLCVLPVLAALVCNSAYTCLSCGGRRGGRRRRRRRLCLLPQEEEAMERLFSTCACICAHTSLYSYMTATSTVPLPAAFCLACLLLFPWLRFQVEDSSCLYACSGGRRGKHAGKSACCPCGGRGGGLSRPLSLSGRGSCAHGISFLCYVLEKRRRKALGSDAGMKRLLFPHTPTFLHLLPILHACTACLPFH